MKAEEYVIGNLESTIESKEMQIEEHRKTAQVFRKRAAAEDNMATSMEEEIKIIRTMIRLYKDR